MESRARTISPVWFFIAFILLRIPTLGPLVLDGDEAWFAAAAANLTGPGAYFETAVDNKPPGTVWFYWLVNICTGAGADPRPARAVAGVLLIVTAFILGRVAHQLKGGKQLVWTVGAGMLAAIALPDPQLFSTTTEGLMLLPLTILLAIFVHASQRPPETRLGSIAGLGLGLSFSMLLILKQTAIFFVPLWLYVVVSLIRSRRITFASGLAVVAGALSLPLVCVGLLGFSDSYYWFWAYPSEVLQEARRELFNQGFYFSKGIVLFGVVLWPFVLRLPALWQGEILGSSSPVRNAILLWLAGALASVVLGRGLFFHYFLYLIPPLALLWGLRHGVRPEGPTRISRELGWLGFVYALVALVVATPVAGILWGTDLGYHALVGEAVRERIDPRQRVFFWSGNALGYVAAERPAATRFLTARFLTPPYATERTLKDFESDFSRSPPDLFVDLHNRGDNRLNISPMTLPWLAQTLAAHYVATKDPAIPWATFYQRSVGAERSAQRKEGAGPPDETPAGTFYPTFESRLRAEPLEVVLQAIRRPRSALALEALLRARQAVSGLAGTDSARHYDSTINDLAAMIDHGIEEEAELLLGSGQSSAGGGRQVRGSERNLELGELALERISSLFDQKELRPPLPLAGLSWWASLALVRLQPVVGPRPER